VGHVDLQQGALI